VWYLEAVDVLVEHIGSGARLMAGGTRVGVLYPTAFDHASYQRWAVWMGSTGCVGIGDDEVGTLHQCDVHQGGGGRR
jgi:hypothetical protein